MSAHHSSKPDETISRMTFEQFAEAGRKADDAVQEKIKELAGLGPTGKFPQGQFTKHDEGEIQFAVFRKDGKVVIDFNSQVTWLAMDPGQAVDLGRILIKHGRELMG